LLARTPSANVEEKQVMQTGLNMLAAWAVTLMIGSTAATATPIITAVTSSGAGSAFINPDPPFSPTFAGIRKEFTGVGPLNLTFTVGNEPGVDRIDFVFEEQIINQTPIDFADIVFAIEDPEGRGVTFEQLAPFRPPAPDLCQPPPGVVSPGTVTCGITPSFVEGGIQINIPDPGPGGSYNFTLIETPIPVSVPEPATLGLLGTGLLVFGLLRHQFRPRPQCGRAAKNPPQQAAGAQSIETERALLCSAVEV
jgi:hypothetical protein